MSKGQLIDLGGCAECQYIVLVSGSERHINLSNQQRYSFPQLCISFVPLTKKSSILLLERVHWYNQGEIYLVLLTEQEVGKV